MKKELLQKFAKFKLTRQSTNEIKGGLEDSGEECHNYGCPYGQNCGGGTKCSRNGSPWGKNYTCTITQGQADSLILTTGGIAQGSRYSSTVGCSRALA
jgi:hypothetical protein